MRPTSESTAKASADTPNVDFTVRGSSASRIDSVDLSHQPIVSATKLDHAFHRPSARAAASPPSSALSASGVASFPPCFAVQGLFWVAEYG